jgi:hypothetical protein
MIKMMLGRIDLAMSGKYTWDEEVERGAAWLVGTAVLVLELNMATAARIPAAILATRCADIERILHDRMGLERIEVISTPIIMIDAYREQPVLYRRCF